MENKASVRRAKEMDTLGLFRGFASIGPIVGIEWSYQFLFSSQSKILGDVEWKTESYVAHRTLFIQPILHYIDLQIIIFFIPTYTSNGGLDIFLAESDEGVRKYEINIPSKMLLQAPRK